MKRTEIADSLRSNTSKSGDEQVCLKDYVDRVKEGQDDEEEAIQLVPRERIQERIVEETMEVPVSRVMEEIVEGVKHIPQERVHEFPIVPLSKSSVGLPSGRSGNKPLKS